MRKRIVVMLVVMGLLIGLAPTAGGAGAEKHIVVKTNVPLTEDVVSELSAYGTIDIAIDSLNAVGMTVEARNLGRIKKLAFVDSIERDVRRYVYGDFSGGLGTWNLDMINITDGDAGGRTIGYNGDGVYVAVLDTGLVKNWRDYLPEDQIAAQYARAFIGGGAVGEKGNENAKGEPANPANMWERDTHSHGTHVSSTILGYNVYGFWQANGVAPKAKVIPVKVLNQNGFGWAVMVAAGICYIGDIADELDGPVVINMSLGGPELSGVEEACIDYAIGEGVIVVASAGNEGLAGMGYPAAYAPVISVGAVGWEREWYGDAYPPVNPYPDDGPNGLPWHFDNVPEADASGFTAEAYVVFFSSVELPGQELDLVAPGMWVLGPFLAYGAAHIPFWARGVPGQYYYLGGTSMSSPHVTGVAALMLQKDDTLNQTVVEAILKANTMTIPTSGTHTDPRAGYVSTWNGSTYYGSGLVDADAAVGATP